MKEKQSDELFPRHVKALGKATKALSEVHVLNMRLRSQDPRFEGFTADEIAAHRKLMKEVREAMKIVRELAAQHRLRRWSNTL